MKIKRAYYLIIVALFFTSTTAISQKAWFIDGYHGGKWGHYPLNYTSFIVEQLKASPNWRINLEIEPETWDMVRVNDSIGYTELQHMYAMEDERIEFVNPAYGQPYFYNISGESIIRQFEYGIKETKRHFPTATFNSYSSEEPCFTSALPQVLRSFGFRYASLKNSNTCWGGYARAYGGEVVNWVGPDGSPILTSPRYAVESLAKKTTWQTIAWKNDSNYINAAFRFGIKNPVGMTLQDAGWKNGPWLQSHSKETVKSEYTTWTKYFNEIAEKMKAPAWRVSQEDILVSLVWGSQVLQKIAQQVKAAENRIVQTEKIAAMQKIFASREWPGLGLDTAWTRLLLAQHHDCWIVPYNGKTGDTWIDKVRNWTQTTMLITDSIINRSSAVTGKSSTSQNIRIFNTSSQRRKVPVFIQTSETDSSGSFTDFKGRYLPTQTSLDSNGNRGLVFLADLPSTGYADFKLASNRPIQKKICSAQQLTNGTWRLESDLYQLIIDPAKGGVIRSLISKQDKREWIDHPNDRSFLEIRGKFYQKKAYRSSTEQAAGIEVIEQGPVRVKVLVKGMIDDSPFQQTITLVNGQQRIDMDLTIYWKGNPGIGNDYHQERAQKAEEYHKAFYDDRDKLLISFPVAIPDQKIFKNAPFDVTASRLSNTYFSTWDSIQNNILLDWVDITDKKQTRGLTVFSDHTGNYLHGKDIPLGLNIQYSGQGLWGMNYRINGATHLRYAILPHQFSWDRAGIEEQRQAWNEPPVVVHNPSASGQYRELIKLSDRNWELVTMLIDGNDLLLRLYNAAGAITPCTIKIGANAAAASLESLNGETIRSLPMKSTQEGISLSLSAPRFSIRTLRLKNIKP